MEEKLKKVFAGIFRIDVENISSETSVQNLEEWDSLAHMKLIFAVEEEFGVVFEEEEISELISFSALMEKLEEKKA